MNGIPEGSLKVSAKKRKRVQPASDMSDSGSDNEVGSSRNAPSRRRTTKRVVQPPPATNLLDGQADAEVTSSLVNDERDGETTLRTQSMGRPPTQSKPGLNMHEFEKNLGEHFPHQVIVLQACKESVPKFPIETNFFFIEETTSTRANAIRKLLALFLLTAHFRMTGLPGVNRKSTNNRNNADSAAPVPAETPPPDETTNDCFTNTLDHGMTKVVTFSYIDNGESKPVAYPTIAVKFEMLLNSSGVPCTYRVWFEVFDTNINFNEAIVSMIARIRTGKVHIPTELKALRKFVEDITSIHAFLDLCKNYFMDNDNIAKIDQALANNTGITSPTSPVAPTKLFSFESGKAQHDGVCDLQNNPSSYMPQDHFSGIPTSMVIAPLPCLAHAFSAANLSPSKINAMRPPFSLKGDLLLKNYAVSRMDDAEFVVKCDPELLLKIRNMVGPRMLSEDEILRFTSTTGQEAGARIMYSLRLRTEGFHYFLRAARIRSKNYAQFVNIMCDLRKGTAQIVQDLMMNYTSMKDSLPNAQYYAIQHLKSTPEAFVFNIGAKFGADVSLESNYIALLRSHFRRFCKIVPGPTELSVLLHWLSSLRIHILPFEEAFALNVLSADQQETGKSFAHEQAIKMCVPGTTMEAQNVTAKAWAGTGFLFYKMVIVTDEANPDLMQPERPGSSLAEYLAIIKSILTKGEITTAMMHIDDNGNRITKVVKMQMKCSFWFGMNAWIPTVQTPLLSRFVIFGFPQSFPKIATVDEHKNTLERDEDPAEVDNFLRHMRDVHALVVLLGFLMDAGRIRPVSRDIMAIVDAELTAKLKEDKFPDLKRRFKDNVVSAATSMCIATSVVMLLDPEFWKGKQRPNFESNPAVFYEHLEQLMYLRREHVVFGLTLMSESIGKQTVQTVLNVIKAFREECIQKKNDVVGELLIDEITRDGNQVKTVKKKDRRYFTIACPDVVTLAKKLRAWLDSPENTKFNEASFLTEHNIISALNYLLTSEMMIQDVGIVELHVPAGFGVVGDQREEMCAILKFGEMNKTVHAAFLVEAVEKSTEKNTVDWMKTFLTGVFSRAYTKPGKILTAFSMHTHIPGTMRHYDYIEIAPDPNKPTFFTSRVGDVVVPRLIDGDLNEALHIEHARNIGVPVNWDLYPENGSSRVSYLFQEYRKGVIHVESENEKIMAGMNQIKNSGANVEMLREMRQQQSDFLYIQSEEQNVYYSDHRHIDQTGSKDIIQQQEIVSKIQSFKQLLAARSNGGSST